VPWEEFFTLSLPFCHCYCTFLPVSSSPCQNPCHLARVICSTPLAKVFFDTGEAGKTTPGTPYEEPSRHIQEQFGDFQNHRLRAQINTVPGP
jgi:hypothetical protein